MQDEGILPVQDWDSLLVNLTTSAEKLAAESKVCQAKLQF